MSQPPSLRLFVPLESLVDGRLRLAGGPATRAYLRGARPQRMLFALDGAGWQHEVAIEHASWERIEGQVITRRLAPERRTKISLHQGLLLPADSRRLVFAAAAAGVVSFAPLITDHSVLPGLDAATDDLVDLAELALEGAEIAGRGRRPALREPALFDRALDEAERAGESIVLVDPQGKSFSEATDRRPFALALLCPPPDGFSTAERERAVERGATVLAVPPDSLPDSVAAPSRPLRLALAALDLLYASLEPDNFESV